MVTSARHSTAAFRVLALLAVGALLVTLAHAQKPADNAKSWKVSVAVGPAFALGKAAQSFAKRVAERSGGALAFELHPGATPAQRAADREFPALPARAAGVA